MSDRTVLEWPPPGMEAMHGRLWRLRMRGLLSFLFVAPAVVWLLLPGAHQPHVVALLMWGLAIGLFFFLRLVTSAAGFFDLYRAARQLGYPRALVLEVALDHSADTHTLVAGVGRYDILRERTRDRVRALRTFSAALHVGAFGLPLPLLCLALVLGLRRSADRLAFALIPLLPSLFLIITAIIVRAYASVLVHWDRGADVWDPSPVSSRERAQQWLVARNAASAAQPTSHTDTAIDAATLPAPSVSPARFSSVVFATAVTVGAVFLFVCIAVVLIATLGIGAVAQSRYQEVLWLYNTRDAVEAEFMRHLRLPADSSISARRAGDALHVLQYPMGGVAPGMRPPVQQYERMLFPHNVPWLPSGDYYWKMVVDRDAQGGLAAPARAALDSVLREPRHPALDYLDVLAKAATIDVVAARYADDVTSDQIGRNLFTARDVWLAGTIDAASTFARGDVAGAELRLRQMLSAGLLLIDGSPFSTDFETGLELASAARVGLEFIYRRTGRENEAAALHAVVPAMRRYGFGPFTQSIPADEMWRIARSSFAYPSVRWRAFEAAVPHDRCGGLRPMLFGASDSAGRHMELMSHALTTTRSDSILFHAVMADTVRRRPAPRRPGIRRMMAVARLVVTDRNVDSPCLGTAPRRF